MPYIGTIRREPPCRAIIHDAGGPLSIKQTHKPDRKRPPRPRTSRPPRLARADASSPEITVKQTPDGRETLAAIEEELTNGFRPLPRPQLDTVRYEERPKERSSRASLGGSSPEIITISEASVGRDTRAAIEEDLAHEALAAALAPGAYPLALPSPSKIFEISIFVVEDDEITIGASEEARRAFVQQRLLHRLPALSMDEVVRISVSPTVISNTVIVRVWSTVRAPF